jgi:hypothetical protein
MTALEEAMLYRDAGAVKRYHTVRTVRQQDLSAHTHGVLMLIKQVYPECSRHLLIAAMHHDLPELITGDVPAPVKRSSPGLAVVLEELEKGAAPLYQDMGLTPFEECVLKWCDTFELVLYCMEEVLMGNDYAAIPMRRGLNWCKNDHPGKVLQATPYTAGVVTALLNQTCKSAGITEEAK